MRLIERINNYQILKKLHKSDIEEEKIRESYRNRGVNVASHAFISLDSNIGKYTYIGNYSVVGKTTIGRYSSIGDFCTIGPGEHRIKNTATSYLLYKDKIGAEYYDGDDGRKSGGVVIGNDVWVGCNVVVSRGVRIGDGAVIGANSFVNKDVPDYAVVAGSPARIIKYRFSDKVISELKESRWWDKDLKDAKAIVNKMDAVICKEKELI